MKGDDVSQDFNDFMAIAFFFFLLGRAIGIAFELYLMWHP